MVKSRWFDDIFSAGRRRETSHFSEVFVIFEPEMQPDGLMLIYDDFNQFSPVVHPLAVIFSPKLNLIDCGSGDRAGCPMSDKLAFKTPLHPSLSLCP